MTTYSAPELLTILAAIGVLITGVGAVVVNVIVALRTGAKVDVAATKTDTLLGKVGEVHTMVNSNLAAVTAKLDAAVTQIVTLRELIADLKSERASTALVTTSLAKDAKDAKDTKSESGGAA